MIFKLEIRICFKTNDQSLFGPTGQLAQPAHSGMAKPTRLGSGLVNRPSPAPLALLSLPSISLATRIAAAVAWLLRLTPVATCDDLKFDTNSKCPLCNPSQSQNHCCDLHNVVDITVIDINSK
jgi:hypothetical protein